MLTGQQVEETAWSPFAQDRPGNHSPDRWPSNASMLTGQQVEETAW